VKKGFELFEEHRGRWRPIVPELGGPRRTGRLSRPVKLISKGGRSQADDAAKADVVGVAVGRVLERAARRYRLRHDS